MIKKQYEFRNAEIGVMSEVMLPKKIQYQGFLFDSLIKGLKEFSFKKHYDDNKTSINKLLLNYKSLQNITDEKLELFDSKFKEIFKGYSMYEVDGVFKFNDKNSPQDIKFSEERTQIVRIYYVPEYEKIKMEIEGDTGCDISLETIINVADLFFQNSKVTSYSFENIQRRIAPLSDETRELEALGFKEKGKEQFDYLINYFTSWTDAIGFFTFGYIIWKITEDLIDMESQQKVPYSEEEIWVASEWGVLINRTILKK